MREMQQLHWLTERKLKCHMKHVNRTLLHAVTHRHVSSLKQAERTAASIKIQSEEKPKKTRGPKRIVSNYWASEHDYCSKRCRWHRVPCSTSNLQCLTCSMIYIYIWKSKRGVVYILFRIKVQSVAHQRCGFMTSESENLFEHRVYCLSASPPTAHHYHGSCTLTNIHGSCPLPLSSSPAPRVTPIRFNPHFTTIMSSLNQNQLEWRHTVTTAFNVNECCYKRTAWVSVRLSLWQSRCEILPSKK